VRREDSYVITLYHEQGSQTSKVQIPSFLSHAMDLLDYLKGAFNVHGVSNDAKRRFVEWYVKSGNAYASLERVVYEAAINDRKVRRLFDELVNAKVMEENVDEDTRTPIPDIFEHPDLGTTKTPGYRLENKYFEILKNEETLKQLLQ
jgi:hypothetical protein